MYLCFFAKQYKSELNALWDCAAGLNSLHCFAMFLWNSNNLLIWESGCFLIRCVTRFILRDLFCAFLTNYNQHQWENYLSPQLCNKIHSFKKKKGRIKSFDRHRKQKHLPYLWYSFFNEKKSLTCKSRFDEWNSLCCSAASPVSLCHDLCFVSVCGQLWYDASLSKSSLLGPGLLHGLNLVLFSPGGLRT